MLGNLARPLLLLFFLLGCSGNAMAIIRAIQVCNETDCVIIPIPHEDVTVEGQLSPADLYFGAQNPGQLAAYFQAMSPQERRERFCEARPTSRICRPADEQQPSCEPGMSYNPETGTCEPDCPGVGAATASNGLFIALETPDQCSNPTTQPGQTPAQTPAQDPASPRTPFYPGAPPCGSIEDHYSRNYEMTNQFLHDTGANLARGALEVGAGLHASYPALTLFLTGYGGHVAGSHYLGVGARAFGGHVAASVTGAYLGLRIGAAIPALRDRLGNCNP